ncbi:hypothetical protein DDB_G0273537 [Dictyostelium discoideum AX4]|uniref:V-type proton ATPase subunit S1/VOA1 transmembrane domain-containing protein n=1 Tax=Dictyostelium discoideum TaxID=44689 RepID=Q557I5_DICDI|nr:hypothetical protein DDB_G0273483 [Dictyostelium discoideum AX4]XP_644650.1 hypothetical protein DDB_G0273537 [Dictyostelium discoideum AX4]EAL70696.1 hypothetical protein DDB_G0273483 [Dictyostelium discoideum AX4]EAL70723.1 hypothetical protein DDB_G0273537 [Dictyostelium discoideum AX4]|eukprot:XP_644601.1 hypothetical protein DDB_G0273483 [Dictyostelium discoideum AX4]
MNKGAIIFLLLNIVLGAVLSSYVPILGWSSKDNVFPSNSVNKYTQEHFKTLIQSIINENSVETLTIFVEPKVLRSDQLSTVFDSYSSNSNGGLFKNLKNSVEESKSHIFVPSSEVGVLNIVSQLKGIKGSVFVAKESDTQFEIEGAQNILLSEASKIQPTLSNKVVDIVVVLLAQNQDSTIKQFQSVVEKSSFVSFFTAASAHEFDVQATFNKQVEQSFLQDGSSSLNSASQQGSGSSSSGSNEPTKQHFTYVTGPVLSAYLIISILLAILFTGICCISDLQVPDRYEAPKSKVL